MTIYVDYLFNWPEEMVAPRARVYGTRWCHMWSDKDGVELLDFAKTIGLSPGWTQHPEDPKLVHFDLTPYMRQKAVKAGAQVKLWGT